MYNIPIIMIVSRNVDIENQLKIKISIFIPVFNNVSAKRYFSFYHILSYFPELYPNLYVQRFMSVTVFLLDCLLRVLC